MSTPHKQLTIGLFGFGVVGEGLYKVLQNTPSLQAYIKKICIKDASKKRNAPAELFTTEANEILFDESINVIVEVISDATVAFEIVSTALKNGKDVVSASKKMIAENLPALLSLQQETKKSFLYEASACASIPVIRNLEEYYDNDLLHSIKAIINGSTNFILTKMFEEKLSYKDAVLLAQQLGFAEANPALDVEGYDAVNKWTEILLHSYGIISNPQDIVFTGIQNINANDAKVAAEKNFQIKLVAQAQKLQSGKIAAFVLPQFVEASNHLSFVLNEYNGVVIESAFADKQFFYGKGAGAFPTASAVLSDISALRYGYAYEYKKLYHHTPTELSNQFFIKVYCSFKDTAYVQKEEFESIEEWFSQDNHKYIIGTIAFEKLAKTNWWKQNNVSIIAMPNALEEDIDIKINKVSILASL